MYGTVLVPYVHFITIIYQSRIIVHKILLIINDISPTFSIIPKEIIYFYNNNFFIRKY